MLGVNGDLLTRCWRSSAMFNFFSDEMRRNPYPVYDQLRAASPVLQVPPPFDA
jgi:hypothetical protein